MLLATALASRLHWEGIGTDENYAAGDWLVVTAAVVWPVALLEAFKHRR